ncbi:putative C2H2 transcription factor [Aspergillus stella-maris]|uniref:putative C2H2 transcription factor n=1 Tax=Aspergillus stella-maris TaxID=1810926 RepID=UPI003CCE1D31
MDSSSSLVYPDDSMLYASSTPFAPLPSSHPVHVTEDYLSYGSQLDPTNSYYPAPTQTHHQSYIPHSNTYYPATTPSQQWLHPSHASPSHHGHGHTHAGHTHTYQDSIPSSDLDPDFDVDVDIDMDLDTDHHSTMHLSPSPSISATASASASANTSTLPSRTPSSTSTTNTKQDSKDLTLYGTPSPSHPGTWQCAYPSCTSPSLFRRGCDLRKHYNRHRKHLFCRHDGCPQANPNVPGAGFSSKKDRDRHEAKHNPGIRCEWHSQGCGRVFSRVDNMKDHVRRIHKGV